MKQNAAEIIRESNHPVYSERHRELKNLQSGTKLWNPADSKKITDKAYAEPCDELLTNIAKDAEKQIELKCNDYENSSKPVHGMSLATKTCATTYVSSYEFQTLLRENQAMKDERMCKICMDNEVNIVFLPCGHLVSCQNCAPAIKKCAVCRSLIRGTVRTYLS